METYEGEQLAASWRFASSVHQTRVPLYRRLLPDCEQSELLLRLSPSLPSGGCDWFGTLSRRLRDLSSSGGGLGHQRGAALLRGRHRQPSLRQLHHVCRLPVCP